MKFTGYSAVFSTKESRQYEAIGQFWDAMSDRYGRDNLRGLGYHWTEDTIEYVIGLKKGEIADDLPIADARHLSVELPDEGWTEYTGRTEQLPELYAEIYRDGPLQYEIETFTEDGDCSVFIHR